VSSTDRPAVRCYTSQTWPLVRIIHSTPSLRAYISTCRRYLPCGWSDQIAQSAELSPRLPGSMPYFESIPACWALLVSILSGSSALALSALSCWALAAQ
jgi:hypothetical protein